MSKILHSIFLVICVTYTTCGQTYTYAGNVAKIIYKNCTSCHRAGNSTPFALESYSQVVEHKAEIYEAVKSKYMPPWSPNTAYSHFLNERVLQDSEITIITEWIKEGAPRGDSLLEPRVPNFKDTSYINNPEFSKRCKKYTVETNEDKFEFFALSCDNNQELFIKEYELVPGNRKIVHHIFLFLDSVGVVAEMVKNGSIKLNKGNYLTAGDLHDVKLIGSWLPGGSYTPLPNHLGFKVPKGSHFILQIHYAPGSKNLSDSTQLNIKFSQDSIVRTMNMKPLIYSRKSTISEPLFIPKDSVKVFTSYTMVAKPISLIAIIPHMHLIGTRMKVYAVGIHNPDTIKLIDDNWNFHWQDVYTFPKMVKLKGGYILWAEGTYDNTAQNQDNPFNPPQDIFEGKATYNEMLQVFFCYVPYEEGDEFKNLDGKEEKIDSLTTIVDIEKDNIFSVYPNPVKSSSLLTINKELKKESLIQLISASGQLIKTYEYFENTISLPSLPSGIYILRILDWEGIFQRKFVID